MNGHGSHKQYNEAIDKKISSIITSNSNTQDALDELKELIQNTKSILKNDVLLGNKNVNDIISF